VGSKRLYEFSRSLELINPRSGKGLTPALLAYGSQDAVDIAVESTRSVFDLVVELCECLDPPGKYAFRHLECLEPFQGAVVSTEDYGCP